MNKEQAKQQLEILQESFNKEVTKLKLIIEQPNKISAEERFWQLTEGLMLKTDWKNYPDSIFFFKEKDWWFEYELKTWQFVVQRFNYLVSFCK